MVKIATVDNGSEQSCEALNHPTECTEPAPGQIQQTAAHGVTITNESGDSQQIATIASADMHFDSHAHDYSSLQGCHDNQSHDIDPDNGSSSITINGSPVYLVKDGVTTDPGSGGDVNITQAGINNSVNQT